MPGQELIDAWQQELHGVDPADVKVALDNLGKTHAEYPPTVFEFANLCRDARRNRVATTPRIAGPRTEMPPHIRQMLHDFVAKHRGA